MGVTLICTAQTSYAEELEECEKLAVTGTQGSFLQTESWYKTTEDLEMMLSTIRVHLIGMGLTSSCCVPSLSCC